jgi:hypothetical protein
MKRRHAIGGALAPLAAPWKATGVTIPQPILLRADRVVE